MLFKTIPEIMLDLPGLALRISAIHGDLCKIFTTNTTLDQFQVMSHRIIDGQCGDRVIQEDPTHE